MSDILHAERTFRDTDDIAERKDRLMRAWEKCRADIAQKLFGYTLTHQPFNVTVTKVDARAEYQGKVVFCKYTLTVEAPDEAERAARMFQYMSPDTLANLYRDLELEGGEDEVEMMHHIMAYQRTYFDGNDKFLFQQKLKDLRQTRFE